MKHRAKSKSPPTEMLMQLDEAQFAIAVLAVTSFTLVFFVLTVTLLMY